MPKYDLISIKDSFGKGKITANKAIDRLMNIGYTFTKAKFTVNQWANPVFPFMKNK